MDEQNSKAKATGDSGKPLPPSAPELGDVSLADSGKRQIESELKVDRDDTPSSVPAEKPKHDPETENSLGARDKDNEAAPDASASSLLPDPDPEPKKPGRLKRFFAGYWRRKKWTLPLTLAVIIGALYAVPVTRYTLAALFIKQHVEVTVIDETTKKPVSSADVNLDGKTFQTDSKGLAIIPEVKVGKRTLTVSKKYYQESSLAIVVPIRSSNNQEVNITATGRQVPISVVNKITGKPLANATLKAVGTEVKTDKEGKAVIVLPADKPTLSATLSGQGYNEMKSVIQVTEAVVKENTFQLVPSGKLYFLSRLSGKIDVVKTNLDGSDRQTAVAGTGKEDDRGTVLLASRDWKYLALQSKRDSGPPKLYLIETETDKLTIMDEGEVVFSPVGWNNHNFVYHITRNTVKDWQPNHQAAKSYDAEKKQILTLDQTQAEGDAANNKYQTFANFYLLGGRLAYTVQWFGFDGFYGASVGDKQSSIRTIALNGNTNAQSKKDVKTFAGDQYNSFQAVLYKPAEVYFAAYGNAEGAYVFYELEGDEVKPASIDQNKFFNDTYATYLESPSGDKVFWSEQRDGRDTFFIGDKNAENPKQVATLNEFQVYGWYSEDYLLASKKGSELYILPSAGGSESKELKVTDYHKPVVTFRGYGGGYGGL